MDNVMNLNAMLSSMASPTLKPPISVQEGVAHELLRSADVVMHPPLMAAWVVGMLKALDEEDELDLGGADELFEP